MGQFSVKISDPEGQFSVEINILSAERCRPSPAGGFAWTTISTATTRPLARWHAAGCSDLFGLSAFGVLLGRRYDGWRLTHQPRLPGPDGREHPGALQRSGLVVRIQG